MKDMKDTWTLARIRDGQMIDGIIRTRENGEGIETTYYTMKLDIAAEIIEMREKQPFPNFWKRLKDFVYDVEIGCAMGEEEKEMILNVCKKQMKN